MAFQGLHFLVLFEKLVEQHDIHRLVADGGDVTLRVMGHQIGIHLRYLLGHEAELRDTRLIELEACNER